MDIQILTQPKLCNGENYTLGDKLNELLSSKRPKFTEASFFFGLVKDNAFEKFFNSISSFILNGGNFKFYLSQPQKGNIKKIINSLLELGCEIYLFKNNSKNNLKEVSSTIVICEENNIKILREGTISKEDILSIFKED